MARDTLKSQKVEVYLQYSAQKVEVYFDILRVSFTSLTQQHGPLME